MASNTRASVPKCRRLSVSRNVHLRLYGKWLPKYVKLDSVDPGQAARCLSTEDPHLFEESLKTLIPGIRKFLRGFLYGKVSHPEDVEDIISDVVIRICSRRESLEFGTLAEFYAYVKVVARHLVYDRSKTKISGPLPPDIEDQKGPENTLDQAWVRDVADEIWLVAPPDMKPRERKARIAALLMYFHDGASVQEIEQTLRLKLADCLDDRYAVYGFCFYSLYFSNRRTLEQILTPGRYLSEVELEKVATRARTETGPSIFEGWTWSEVHVLILRFRNGLITSKLFQILPQFDKEFIETTINRGLAALPMEQVTDKVAKHLANELIEFNPLSDQDLYKRLAFQYHVFDYLPQLQILERILPAPTKSGVNLNGDILTMWISGRRLMKQFEKYVKEKHGRDL
jgi:DNA-directed RNA polymerase specialized sigma24 family protein